MLAVRELLNAAALQGAHLQPLFRARVLSTGRALGLDYPLAPCVSASSGGWGGNGIVVLPLTTCHRPEQAVPDASGAFLSVSQRQWRMAVRAQGMSCGEQALQAAGCTLALGCSFPQSGGNGMLACHTPPYQLEKKHMGIFMALDFECLAQISALSWRDLTSVF